MLVLCLVVCNKPKELILGRLIARCINHSSKLCANKELLQENKLSLARQLEEVNAKLHDLMSDKKELERSQNMISHVLTAQFTHIEQLFSHQVTPSEANG